MVKVKPVKQTKINGLLREDLGLTGTKDGCNQGSCGACTVLVNGKASKACLFTLEKLAGKEVTTIEGLSQRQKMSMPMRLQKRVQFSAGIASTGWLFRHKDY